MECGFTAFVQTLGTQFVVDGHPFYINGFNAYFLMAVSVDVNSRHTATALFKEAASAGLNVVRTWAFNDGGYQALQISPGVYDEQTFQALDFVISEANRFGIRLILTLVNNFNDYGGKAQYVQWGRSAGLSLNSEDAFFTDSTVKGYYRNHVKTVLTRVNTITGIAYMDDPAIFSWELMNEPRCFSDQSGNALQGWIEEMAAYVKAIDCKHLLDIGLEGFYGPASPNRRSVNPNSYCEQLGTDFVRNHGASGIDFSTVHAYPDAWMGSSTSLQQQIGFMESWISNHLEDCTQTLQMPMLLAEFGMSDKDPGFSVSNRDSFMSAIYDAFYKSACSGGPGAGTLVWQLFPEGMDNWSDGNQIVLSRNPSTAAIIMNQSKRLQILNTATMTDLRAKH
eukprot:c19949_g1_i1 orf=696-1877(-)